MNGTAARRTAPAPLLEWAPPPELVGGLDAVHPSPVGHPRGKSSLRGLLVQATYAAIDVVFVCLGGVTIFLLRFSLMHRMGITAELFRSPSAQAYLGFFLLYAALIVLSCVSYNLYRTPRERSVFDESWMVVKAIAVATALLSLFIFTSGNKEISRLVVWCSGVFSVITLSGWRAAKRQLVRRRTQAGINVRRALIVGTGRLGRALARWLEENPQFGYVVCGFLDSHRSANPRVLGAIKDLRSVMLAHFVDELFITLPADRTLVKHLVLQARRLRLSLKVVPDLYDGLAWQAPLHTLGGFPLMELCRQPIPALGLAIKRVTDIIVASLLLVAVAPLLALLALLIQLDSQGPVFYIADRVGRKGVKFRCYKLRTMVVGADEQKDELRNGNERNGPFFKLTDDPRITPLGRWLRKLSLDEIPQLWNVLRGEMSLVGPRPHPVDDFERYDIEHLRRLDVKPGLTGLWQVTARRDPSFDTNMALDLEYIENWSLWLDLKIALRTVPAILRAEGN
jgi:exopolysaccharide biosynthesis polyprenyl glycosylphosphotransferase